MPLNTDPKGRIPTFRDLRALIREDYATNMHSIWSPGFQAVATYRLGVWCDGIKSRLLRVPVRWIYNALSHKQRNVNGIDLPWRAQVGRRLRIAHQHGIVIHHRTVIGDDCLIRHGVTIGLLRPGTAGLLPPRLGNKVEIGAGAVLVGAITIGDGVIIGPNAVVTTNVRAGSVVVSPQSRIMAPVPRRKPAPDPSAE